MEFPEEGEGGGQERKSRPHLLLLGGRELVVLLQHHQEVQDLLPHPVQCHQVVQPEVQGHQLPHQLRNTAGYTQNLVRQQPQCQARGLDRDPVREPQTLCGVREHHPHNVNGVPALLLRQTHVEPGDTQLQQREQYILEEASADMPGVHHREAGETQSLPGAAQPADPDDPQVH